MQQNGWGGPTSSTASGRSSPAKSSDIIFQTLYNMETSKSSTRQLTLDELIFSQEGSPASPTLSQANKEATKTTATCGRRCCALFENAPRATSWARTFSALLVGMEGWYSRRCALTWKLKGTPYNRMYFQLQASTLPTEDIESGLLLTPRTSEEVEDLDKFKERMQKYPNGTKIPNLATQVAGMLPTPRTTDVEGGAVSNVKNDGKGWYRENAKGERWGVKLRDVVESGLLPTPTTDERDSKYAQGGTNLRAKLGTSSQLSPLFVEEMMGFPKNWTASPFQSGDEKALKPTGTPSSRK